MSDTIYSESHETAIELIHAEREYIQFHNSLVKEQLVRIQEMLGQPITLDALVEIRSAANRASNLLPTTAPKKWSVEAWQREQKERAAKRAADEKRAMKDAAMAKAMERLA